MGFLRSTELIWAAARGLWSLRILADPQAPALAQTTFLVEDFVPERIDYTARFASGQILLDASNDIEIDARYLYGAPGAGLSIEGDLTLSAADGLAARDTMVGDASVEMARYARIWQDAL